MGTSYTGGRIDTREMLTRILCLIILAVGIHAISLDEFEQELEQEGVDLSAVHAEKKRESEEVVREFSDKATQDEIARLREGFEPLAEETVEVKTELEINGELARDLFQGDIRLTPEQWKVASERDPNVTLQRRQAMTEAVRLWSPMGAPIIPYGYTSSFPQNEKAKVLSALRFWESRTCVKFREATSSDRAKVVFDNADDGCWSYVGKVGNAQNVNLGRGCMSFTVIAHEVSHAFGTLHVQSRADRDTYVYVDTANVQSGMISNFYKDPNGYGKLDNYGIPYEFGSMQHYHESAFAVNRNKPTIIAKPAYQKYQKSMEGPRATFYDTLLINKIYKCTDKCRSKITCQNNGVQDGADCNKCFCPRGYSGTYCERRADNARFTQLNSGTSTKKFTMNAGNGNFLEELHIIQAPAGRRIRAVIKRWGDTFFSMCRSSGMEVIFSKDTRVSGFRLCNKPDSSAIDSEANEMMIWIYNEHNRPIWTEVEFTVL